ncbi:hypothetical protein LWC35_13045 [Pseudonocardia kujensis]|uniref:hypothetical protein n=1 Tax=Pseudonocardia kujensis TaxID=1128675 RepID=UPI001E56A2F1|nr:hypothetical protein [Pseudonocardia kujensis]MCE0763828.1 hypothetical protein [Pseudonocardia kujensis]
MSLASVWLQLHDGSLVRADQATEITVHPTPALTGKPAHWLLTVTVPVPVGSGDRGGWRTEPLHRTLTQTATPPTDAPVALARLLARLDAADAAGVVRADTSHVRHAPHPDHAVGAGEVRFGFTAFAGAGPGTALDGVVSPDDPEELADDRPRRAALAGSGAAPR